MNISELIEKLQRILDESGNLDVVVKDHYDEYLNAFVQTETIYSSKMKVVAISGCLIY